MPSSTFQAMDQPCSYYFGRMCRGSNPHAVEICTSIVRAILARQALLHMLNLILSFTQPQVRVHSGASNSSTLTSPGEI